MEDLSILSWNARSTKNKTFSLKVYMYSKKPHLVLIQETWFRSSNFEPNFINYRSIWNNREYQEGEEL